MTSITKVSREEMRVLILIVLVAVCGLLGIDIHLASLPHIMHYMHTDKAHIQQSISIYLLGLGFSMLFYGPLSDKYGRKPIVIIGLTIATLASFASVFTTHINAFLITRLFQGLGAGVCMGLGRSIVADVLQGDRLAAIGSYFSMFISLSPLLAPALGGYIQHWYGWQANFIVLGALIGLSLLLYTLFCPETNKHKNPNAFSLNGLYHSYKTLLTHPIFVFCTLISGIAIAANMVYATISPFVFQIDFHMTPIAYGWVTAVVALGGIVGKFVGPTAIRRIGSLHTLLVGLWLLVVAGLWISLFVLLRMINVPLIMIAVFATIFSQSFIMPNTMSRALSPHHDKRGAAGALYGGFQMLIAFVTSATIASLPHSGVWILAITYVVLGLIGIVLYFKVPE